MDLGFGNSNQIVGDATTKVLLASTQAQESALDDELAKYDALLEDEDALDRLREARLAKLKQQSKQQKQWREKGHGSYTELNDDADKAKAFFQAAKASDRLIVHFYRPTTTLCDVFHQHLEKLSQQHLETRFVKINVEDAEEGKQNAGGVTYLVDKLGIVVMPTLLLVKKRQAVHHIRGFDELGGSTDFSTKTLAFVLRHYGMLFRNGGIENDGDDDEDGTNGNDDDEIPEELMMSSRKGVKSIRLSKGCVRKGFTKEEDEF